MTSPDEISPMLPIRSRLSPFVPALLALAALLTTAPEVRAQGGRDLPPVEIENLRIGFDNSYKLGSWTPIRVQLRAGAGRFTGFVEVIVPDDDDVPTFVRQGVDIPAGQTFTPTLYFRAGSPNNEIAVRIRDQNGRDLHIDVPTESLNLTKAIYPGQLLLGTLGNPQGVNLITSLPEYKAPQTPGSPTMTGAGEVLVVAPIAVPEALPGAARGYESFEAVVVDTRNPQVLSALNAGPGQALKEWVRNGGHLVVSIGANWQSVRDSVLDEMLPAVPNGQISLNDLGGLETYAGSNVPLTPADGGSVSVAKLEQIEARGGKVLDPTAATPLVVRGVYGFGRVTLLAFDTDSPPFSTWEDRKRLWTKALDLRPLTVAVTTTNPNNAFYSYAVNDLSTTLRSALDQFPGVRLVPFGWVAFFIFLYILLIGPGDYFFLKKVVKRMEMTWVTFPIIVITVSLLAYYAAYAVKGTDLRINKFDIVDIDQTGKRIRGMSWLALFSPQNRDYSVSFAPRALSGSAATPTPAVVPYRGDERLPAEAQVMTSWFGTPENRFGGMNNPNRISLSGNGYDYAPLGAAQAVEGVRVPIWSTKSFLGQWTARNPDAPLVEAPLEMVGSDRLAGTIVNRSTVPLNNAVLMFGTQAWELGTIQPGGSVRVEQITNQALSGYLERLGSGFQQGNNGYNPYATPTNAARIDRTALLRVMMFRDALEIKSPLPPSRAMRSADLTGLLSLGRPILIAGIDGPGSTLRLASTVTEPKIDQTTMVRIVLPPAKTAE